MPFNDDEPIQKYIPHISLESHLNLSIQTDTSYIDSNKTHSLPVTVSLAVAPLELTYRPPLDIVIVVEKSHEISHDFFEATRLSIHQVLNTLNLLWTEYIKIDDILKIKVSELERRVNLIES